MSRQIPTSDNFWRLINSACDGSLVDIQVQELATLLDADPTVRKVFIRHVQLRTDIQFLYRAEHACGGGLARVQATFPQATPSFSPIPSFLSTAYHGTIGFFSQELPFSLLIAAVLTGLGLWIASLVYVSSPEKIAKNSLPTATIVDPTMEVVGKITGMVDCNWADPQTATIDGANVLLGRKYALSSGLMEITYRTGAKVILQGPVTYGVESRNGGFLAIGKLTGKVEVEAAKGFSVRTPTATVVDLGTEFSVEVRPDQTTDVHVVRGAVEAVRDGRTGGVPAREHLVAGEAMRFGAVDAPPKRISVQPLRVATVPSPSEAWREVRDARQSMLLLQPVGLVATTYHRVWDANGKLLAVNDRQQAFRVVTDGIFGRGETGAGPRSSFDTLLSTAEMAIKTTTPASTHKADQSKTNFVGLLYGCRMRFDRIKVFLGRQMGDGGNWSEMPRIFILQTPVDTGSTSPESDSINWRELPLRRGYGIPFDPNPDANPGAVIEIPLTGFPSGRVGYGWAIGGVAGNGPAGYVSITELRAYGQRLEDKEVRGKKP